MRSTARRVGPRLCGPRPRVETDIEGICPRRRGSDRRTFSCCANSRFISPLRTLLQAFLIRGVSPSFAMHPRRPHHLTSGRALWARTIIPRARGRRARVGGTILLSGMFQPRESAVTARPDPAKPSRSASLEWGQVIKPSLACWSGVESSGYAALNTAPSGTTPWVT